MHSGNARETCFYVAFMTERSYLRTSTFSICQSIAEMQPQSSFGIMPSNLNTVLSIDTKSITFCWHGLMMMRFDFGENQTNSLRVRKSMFLKKIKMAHRKFSQLWQNWYLWSQHGLKKYFKIYLFIKFLYNRLNESKVLIFLEISL